MELAERTRFARFAPVFVSLALLCLPWALPEWPALRMLAGLLAWLAITKTSDLLREAPRDAHTRTSIIAFLLWCLMPAAVRWPADDLQKSHVQRLGLRRALHGLFKAALVASLIGLSALWPELHAQPGVRAAFGLGIGYAVFSGGIDLVTSLPMLYGIFVHEIFDRPYAATSPQDFWGRRWNQWIGGFLRQQVFIPLRRSPKLALLAVFAVSGLAHEYLIIAALGTTRGQMLAFFLLQGLSVLLTRRFPRAVSPWSRVAAWTLHTAWLLVTGPLFMEPVLRAVPLDRAAIFSVDESGSRCTGTEQRRTTAGASPASELLEDGTLAVEMDPQSSGQPMQPRSATTARALFAPTAAASIVVVRSR